MSNPTPYKSAWPPRNREYFTIKVMKSQVLENVSKVLWAVHEKDDLFVGPSIRLTSAVGRVQLDTRDLAERFCEHARQVLGKRHGNKFNCWWCPDKFNCWWCPVWLPTKISHRKKIPGQRANAPGE